MGWFKKKEDVVDLGERYRRQQERLAQQREEVVSQTPEKPPTFFQGLVNAAQQNAVQTETEENEYADLGDSIEQRRRKLSKRFIEMTSKMEDISNQIYHLQQRIELIERKMGIGRG